MRHIYLMKDNEEKRKRTFDFISLILIILESYVVGSKVKKANNSECDDEESKESLINLIHTDKLSLANKIHIVSNEYYRIYEIFRKKFFYQLTSAERKRRKYSIAYTASYSFSRLPSKSTFQRERTNIISYKTPTKKETVFEHGNNDSKFELAFATDTKSSRKEIIIRISQIFLEFLKYLENEYIDRVEENLVRLKSAYENGSKALEIKNDKVKLVVDDLNEEQRTNTILLTDILKMAYLNDIKKFEDYAILSSGNNKSLALTSYGNCLDLLCEFSKVFIDMKDKIFKDKKEDAYKVGFVSYGNVSLRNGENVISEIFLKCIQKFDIDDLKQICLEILFRLNSQNFIFFENLSNLVIFANLTDLEKFEDIKKIFIELFIMLKNLFSTSVLDSTIITQIEQFGIELNKLLTKVFDKKKWIAKCEELKMYKCIDDDLSHHSPIQSQILSRNSSISPRGSRLGEAQQEIKNEQENKSKEENENESESEDEKLSPYFLTKITDERIQLVQQVLFNLGFSDMLIKFMEKSNQIIIKFSETEQNEPNLPHFAKSVEKIQTCLDDIYRLLGLFIKNNKKHQIIIEEHIELILFPISLTNNITTSVMISLSSFLLEFLRDFSVNELNNVENLIKMLTMLIRSYML